LGPNFGQVEHGNNWGTIWSIFLVEKVEFFIIHLTTATPPLVCKPCGNDKHTLKKENGDNKMEKAKQPN
jgi:hypothetical protein